MLACSVLIESSSKLLVTRTGMKARSSLILGRIRPLILEFLALEWQKFHIFELEYLWSKLVSLDKILYVASLGWGERLHKVLGQIDLAHWTQVSDRCPLGYLFNIFSSEATGSVEAKFYVAALWVGGTKVPSNGLGHMTKMAAMPI